MRAYLFFTTLAAVTFFSTSLYAQQAETKQFYIGAGGSYAVENFFDDRDFENSLGIDLKFGYHLHPLADIEFDVNCLDEFESREIQSPGVELDTSLSVTTYMLVMKGYFPIDSEAVRLSAVVGGGIMAADFDSHFYGTGDDADLCFKLGLGLDVFVSQEVSFGFEGSWTNGIDNISGNFKDFGSIEYFNFTLGAAYHF